MNYVFFGTPRFAEIVLDGLIRANKPPIMIVCNPDRPVGRKKIVTPPPTKILGERHNIRILQPEKLDADAIRQLQQLKPDFFVVAAYAKIIPQAILDIPRLGTLGVHPSLLPKYRGASPIQSAILGGETKTGTTIYLMDEKMDNGPMLASEEMPIASDNTYVTLEEKLANLGAELLIKTIPDFFAGKTKPKPQDDAQATFTKKFKTEDGFIESADLESAERGDAELIKMILNKINAFNPEPGAWTIKNGKRIKLMKAEIQNGRLRILEQQTEGEKPKKL